MSESLHQEAVVMSHTPFPRSRVRTAPPSAPIAILWAGSAAVVPTLIRLSVDHLVSDVTIFPAYFPFVMAAATFLGWRSAMVAAILSTLAANYMFMGARFELSAAPTDIVSSLMFLVSASIVIVGVEKLKSATRADDLEQASSRPAGASSRPLSSGHGLLLATALALVTWVAVVWGAIHAFHAFRVLA
jgi:K+-sensing histidine kinase KdpD